MSAKIMAEVAAFSKSKGSAQHILLLLASYVNDAGTGAYPAMQTLAERAGITERHVQRCIRSLEEGGHIAVERRKEPGKRPRNIYTILRAWRGSAQMNTDNGVQMNTDNTAQMNTDMFTDMFTDIMSVDPKKDPEEEKNARAPETDGKTERLLEWLALPRDSEAWNVVMRTNGVVHGRH